MTRPWDVVLHEDAVSFLLSCRSTERNKVLRSLEQLRESPSLPGHFEVSYHSENVPLWPR